MVSFRSVRSMHCRSSIPSPKMGRVREGVDFRYRGSGGTINLYPDPPPAWGRGKKKLANAKAEPSHDANLRVG